jgi:uncharacterized DUF497 family protein
VEFEWDVQKAAANLAKHGVRFATAQHVFEDPRQISVRSLYTAELRWKTTGDVDGVLLTVVHTYRRSVDGKFVRIISARPASRAERAGYQRARG